METGFCATTDCGKALGSANRSGYCSLHGSRIRARAQWEAANIGRAVHTCATEGCDKRLRADNRSGYCRAHGKAVESTSRYLASRYGDAAPAQQICAEPGCGKPLRRHNKRGYCAAHLVIAARPSGTSTKVCAVDSCDAPLGIQNISGLCLRHSLSEVTASGVAVRTLGGRPTCAEPGCTRRLNNRNTTGLCAPHRPRMTPEQRRANRAATIARYRQKNPNKGSEDEQVRRARKAALFVERVRRQVVWDRDGGICHLCGALADPSDWHVDHVIPIAKGGPHSYGNVAVTHSGCNWSKNAYRTGSPNPAVDARARAAYKAFHGVTV